MVQRFRSSAAELYPGKGKTLKDLIPSYLVGSEAPFTFAESTLIYLGASRNTEKELKHHTGELVVSFSA